MSHGQRPIAGRLQELLAGWAMGDLSADERQELAGLADPETWGSLGEEFELTAAALDRLWSARATGADETGGDELPASLRSAIREQARQHPRFQSRSDAAALAATRETRRASDPRENDSRVSPDLAPQSRSAPGSVGMGWRESCAWLAMAASLLVAVGLWFRGERGPSGRPDLLAARQQLLQTAPDTIEADFGPGKTPLAAPAAGDVVWSNSRQQGFLRLDGLPINDPRREQYQLWIIDPQRDDEPIDGGVFDIRSTGEAIIPISAKLGVIDPQAFAITIEKPGGVVVSTQERLPLLAVVRR